MSKILLSPLCSDALRSYLTREGHELVFTEKLKNVDSGIAYHPDIICCSLGNGIFFGDPDRLGSVYPKDVIYNAACTGRYFLHRLEYTDPQLLSMTKTAGMEMIDVPQGYAKCNILIVDEKHIITSDRGIAKAIDKYNDSACGNGSRLDYLLIDGGGVHLPGFKEGFIGGASGRVGKSILFNGDLSGHNNLREISSYIEDCGLETVWFEGHELTDIGSIIEFP